MNVTNSVSKTKPILLDGKVTAQKYHAQSKQIIAQYNAKYSLTPKLATILVGSDPASETYVKMKHKACLKVGLEPLAFNIDASADTQKVIDVITQLNADPSVFGILLQHPIAPQMDERLCFDSIHINKDVDGVTSNGYGRLSMGIANTFGSCTPQGIMYLLQQYNIDVAGLNAVVIGRSPILGKPMAAMLLEKNATVTVCHSKTKNLPEHIQNADLIVAAVGKKQFVNDQWIKDNTIVIDAGYHPGGVGDVLMTPELLQRVHAYTPVPGGVGPMTIAVLIYQTALAIQTATK